MSREEKIQEELESQIIKKAKASVSVPVKTEAEVNLLVYPFFALSRKEARSKIETVYEKEESLPEGKKKKVWQVTANAKYGYPGPFDRKVFRAIESIISEMEKPIANPIPFTLYDLCKRIGIDLNSGKNRQNIKAAVERIVSTTVRAEGTFLSKEDGKIEARKTFHLYDLVVFYGQEMPNGDTSETNYIYLNELYLRSINAFYVKPLDYEYLRELNSSVAERLYELLGVKFYGMPENQPVMRYLYSTICDLLPIKRQKYLSLAKKNLDAAFKELTETKFFAKEPKWEKTDKKDDWYIWFQEGDRAKQEKAKQSKQLEFYWMHEALAEPKMKSLAEEMVIYFYQILHETEDVDHEPSKSEISLAEKYLNKVGEEGLRDIIHRTIKHARRTKWDVKAFGSIKSVASEVLAENTKQEKARVKREQEELKYEYERFIDSELSKYLESLPREELDKVVIEEKKRILKTVGNKKLEDFSNSPMLKGMLEIGVMTRLRGQVELPTFEEWKEKVLVK